MRTVILRATLGISLSGSLAQAQQPDQRPPAVGEATPSPRADAGSYKSSAISASIWCPGTDASPAKRLDIVTSASGAAPYVRLSPIGAEGLWLVDYGATGSSANRLASLPDDDPRWLGTDRKKLKLAGFDFPYEQPHVEVLNLEREFQAGSAGAQQGVIGTDILARHTVELHYEDPADQHVLVSAPSCIVSKPSEWYQVLQKGYFGTKPAHFATQGVNVPVVFTAFERADQTLSAKTVPTQIDTGFSDEIWPHTIYANPELWKQIKGGAVLVGKTNTKQCDGSADQEVWILPMTQLQFTSSTDFWFKKFPAFYVVPLAEPKPGSQCGGIATMKVPAAQIGASFLRSLGTIIIDPGAFGDGGAVWVRK